MTEKNIELKFTFNGIGDFAHTFKTGSQPFPLHIQMAYNAKSFYIAGQRCLQNIPFSGGYEVCVGPGVVCHCLSIELLIKALIHHDGKSVKPIHKLCDLLNAVDKKHSYVIRQKYNLFIPEPGFDQLVEKANYLFVNARYEYEHDFLEFPETQIQILNKIVYEYCEQLWELF